jgi:hypothetical protein
LRALRFFRISAIAAFITLSSSRSISFLVSTLGTLCLHHHLQSFYHHHHSTGITGNIYDVFVKPYFMDAYRPVKRGDRFMSRRAMKSVEFKIVEVEPGPYAIVGPDTLVDCKGDPIKRRDESKLSDVGYDDVGGVSKQVTQ